jgi:hypothetical protein
MAITFNTRTAVALLLIILVILPIVIVPIWLMSSPFGANARPFRGALPAAEPKAETDKSTDPTPAFTIESLDMEEDASLSQRSRGSKPPQFILVVERLAAGKLKITYGLPAPNIRGEPRLFRGWDSKTEKTFLLLAPPLPANPSVERQIKVLSSAWQEVLSIPEDGDLSSADAGPIADFQCQPFGPCLRIELPETGVVWQGMKPTTYEQFDPLELDNAVAMLKRIHQPENETLRKAMKDVIEKDPIYGFFWDQHFSKVNIQEELQSLKKIRGFVPRFQTFKKSDSTARAIRFDGSQLKWYNLRHHNAVSPWLRIEFIVPEGSIGIELLGRVGTDVEIGNEIYAIQRRVAETIAAEWEKLPAAEWPGEVWMGQNHNAGSLNPFTFIAILQSLEATSGDSSDLSALSPAQAASRKATELLMGRMTSGHIAKMRDTLLAIESAHTGNRSVQHYHNTYLYCEYLVALVHLKRLHNRLPLHSKFRLGPDIDGDLDELIFKAAGVIGQNIENDGSFKRYLKGTSSEKDRSIGQVALYSLQYTHFLYREENPPPTELAGVVDSLRKLSNWYSNRDGVSYADGSPASAHLHPAYFQAQIAKVQIMSDTEAKAITHEDIAKLGKVFAAGNYPRGHESVNDAYRWMYWSRVFELLSNLRAAQGVTFPSNSNASLGELETALKLNLTPRIVLPKQEWTPNKIAALPANPSVPYPDAAAREIMLMIGMESMRSILKNKPPANSQPAAAK